MTDFGIRGYPLLALLAVAHLVEPMRSTRQCDPEGAPPVAHASAPATGVAPDHAAISRPRRDVDPERGLALLLLLGDAADRWRVR